MDVNAFVSITALIGIAACVAAALLVFIKSELFYHNSLASKIARRFRKE